MSFLVHFLLLTGLTYIPYLTSASQIEARAEVCSEACRNVMRWEECVRANQCNRLYGDQRLSCVDSCLYSAIGCEFKCWDSFDVIMNSCQGSCGDATSTSSVTECQRTCFLQKYQAL